MELVQMPDVQKEGIYLGAMIPDAVEALFPIATAKRKEQKVTLEYASKGFKSHMKGVDKMNARYGVLIGEDELKDGTLWVKDFETKEERTLTVEEFLSSSL